MEPKPELNNFGSARLLIKSWKKAYRYTNYYKLNTVPAIKARSPLGRVRRDCGLNPLRLSEVRGGAGLLTSIHGAGPDIIVTPTRGGYGCACRPTGRLVHVGLVLSWRRRRRTFRRRPRPRNYPLLGPLAVRFDDHVRFGTTSRRQSVAVLVEGGRQR